MFRFANIEFLYLLILIPLLAAVLAFVSMRRKRLLARFGNVELLKTLMPDFSRSRQRLKAALYLVALTLLILAAARPQLGSKLREVKAEGVEMMLVVDVSNSMLAEDFEPNRLERTKYAIQKLFESLKQERVGLVAFAGEPKVQLPITSDYRMAQAFTRRLSTSLVAEQGTAIGRALELAMLSYSSQSERSRVMVLITDGENHEDDAIEAAEKAAAQAEWFSGAAPKVDWSLVQQKAGDATRNASAAVLSQLAKQVPNMICSSADLSNSDKTDGFLKETTSFVPGDFSGAFFQAGVAELTMACCCIGMALHGGVIAACGTFFVFSDYMKPAVRMAALMELPVKFIWTHDAFRVGEDGPTHEPVEQEAQIRLMEKLKNHHGKNSVLVLRPADSDETTQCWKMAMENVDSPTALILSRQNIDQLPEGTEYAQAEKGAYIVAGSEENPDVILVASGSEVATLVAGAALLREDGIKVRIVSCPSEGLFRSQPKEYQQAILPCGAMIFGLTAGLPVNLEGLVGCNGKVFGLESFGFSAPYKVLDEKLGFTAQNVYNQVKAMF
jgi:transketolase C-terminal domain/subunit